MTQQVPSAMMAGDAAMPLPAGSVTLAQLVAAVQQALLPTGSIIAMAATAIPTGFVAADGSLLTRATYPALSAHALASGNLAASDTVWHPGQYSPGNGSTTFRVPNLNGRMLVGAGSAGTEIEVVSSVAASGNAIAVGTNSTRWVTGQVVVVSNASGFTGLTNGTWYIVRNTSTSVKFATSLVNAQNGTVATVTGTGSCTITATLTARGLGETGGEEAHAMSATELLAHTHTIAAQINAAGPAAGAQTYANSVNNGNMTTNSTGGNVGMNVMNPYAAVNYYIKT